MAVQAGLLPLSPADIEWALDLNGVQVDRNVKAFRLGRQHAAFGITAPVDGTSQKRSAKTHTIASTVGAVAGTALGDVVRHRVDEPTASQNARRAERYTHQAEEVRTVTAAPPPVNPANTQAQAP